MYLAPFVIKRDCSCVFIASGSDSLKIIFEISSKKNHSCFRVISSDKSAISERHLFCVSKVARTKPVSVGVGGNDYCRVTGSLLSRGKYEWPKRVWSHDCDRRHTLVVLLSFMIYDDRPRKGTSLNPALPRPYICVTCKIAHFTALCELLEV